MEHVMTLNKLVRRGLGWVGFAAAACLAANAATPIVTTVAGGYVGDGKPATSASLAYPVAVARDASGNLYISDGSHCRIRKVVPTGTIRTFAGTGICGYSGDGGPAKSATVSFPAGLAFDTKGNLIFADEYNSVIRMISPAGTISTIAGNGIAGYSGDGGPATSSNLAFPQGVSVDSTGRIYIADSSNAVIRMVDTAGVIHTVAGNHTSGFSGDGGPATSAEISSAMSVLAGSGGAFYIADTFNDRVRKVNPAGIISTLAGNGFAGNSGSGGPATAATIGGVRGLVSSSGKLYISTYGNIWVFNPGTQIITLIAGDPTGANVGYNGDGNAALSTDFSGPWGMAAGSGATLLVADTGNARIRQISGTQIVTTLAGGYVGDGGPATAAGLNYQGHIAFDPAGNLYIPDTYNNRVRKVTPSGTITTFAGTGFVGYSGDGGPASAATFQGPQGVAADGNGNVYIADTGNGVIRKVDSSGTITTFLTTLTASNGFAVSAAAYGMNVDGSGNLYAADGVFAVWKITPSGSTSIVAGVLYDLGYNGDGMPATQAWLYLPRGVAVDGAGNVYIADWLNSRVRKVDTAGNISTVAGNGNFGFSGDHGPATSATLWDPQDVAIDAKGNLYIADTFNYRIRVVNPAGTINTLAGSGGYDYNGNNLPVTKTGMYAPAVTLDPNGVVYYSDDGSYRVRKIH
jgi:sugar lactone lactonase YvrE